MEIFRFNILPLGEIEKREAYKAAVNNCPICNQKLEFNYDYDYLTNELKENAHCQGCGIQIRTEQHKVQ